MDIFRIFHLQCARRLPGLPAEHPCSRLHGHSFKIEITATGPVNAVHGWVMDFAEMDSAWLKVHNALDHRCLNEIAGLENPTSENLAMWLWQALQADLPQLSKIAVMETHDMGCVYRGPT